MLNSTEKASEMITQDAQEKLNKEVSVPAETDSQESTPAETSDAPAEAGQPSQSAAQGALATGLSRINACSMRDYLKQHFRNDLKEYRQYSNRDTGFSNMDPLHAGLYVIGAVASSGKTTFIYQMADQLATNGVPVIFFTLEQSLLELTTKSLSRRIFLRSAGDPSYRRYTAKQIRDGDADYSSELPEQIDSMFQDIGDNLTLVGAQFSIDVETIISMSDAFMAKHNGVPPVIIIDYLQIIASSKTDKGTIVDPRMAMDHIVHKLKVYQMKTGATIICVSSLNRMNYTEHISFESFKESGGIEYTADVVWGLELSVINTPEFETIEKEKVNANGTISRTPKPTTTSDKRRILDAAKAQPVRDLSLITLKNRFGAVSTCHSFRYSAAYDVFVPINGSAPTKSPGTPMSGDPNPYT